MVETGGWGGIAHYAWNLGEALAEAGADVRLLTNVRYELEPLPRRFATERCLAGDAGYVRNARTLVRRLETFRPDVVHVQSLLSTRWDVFLWPRVRRRVPVVLTAHNLRSHEPALWDDWVLWRCLGAADAVVVHTQESADVVAARLGPRGRVRVIHHGDYAFFGAGADAPRDRAAARRQLGLPASGPIILVFGAIRPYKGILGVIAALPRIRARHPDARLVIAGPLLVGTAAEYRGAIARAGVGDAVAFRPGYVPHEEVAAYFAAADVAVFNYREVTDSGSLRIACSLGSPVVATAVGAFREFLTDGVTGRLVPPDDPESLARAVGDVLADAPGAARMTAAARALAAARWSWADSAKATLELYREIRRPGAPEPSPRRRGDA